MLERIKEVFRIGYKQTDMTLSKLIKEFDTECRKTEIRLNLIITIIDYLQKTIGKRYGIRM